MDTVGQKIAAPGPKAAARPSQPMANLKQNLGNWGPVVLLTLGSLWLIQGALAHTSDHGVFISGVDCNAGPVKAGSLISHDIRLINLSSQPVEVYAQAGCGCTVVEMPNRAIRPWHSEIVTTVIDTSGIRKGLQQRGVILQMQSGVKIWQQVTFVRFHLQ